MNKKEKQNALKSALTSRVQADKFIVVDSIKLDEIKTKAMATALNKLNASKALVVMSSIDENVVCSAKNIPNVKTSYFFKDEDGVKSTINVYDIMKYDTVVIDKAAVATIEEVYA